MTSTSEIIRELPSEIPKSNCRGVSQRDFFDVKINVNNFNKAVRDAISEINKLEKWDEYIIFNGEKYGKTKILQVDHPLLKRKLIHQENDCKGSIERDIVEDNQDFYIEYAVYRCETCSELIRLNDIKSARNIITPLMSEKDIFRGLNL